MRLPKIFFGEYEPEKYQCISVDDDIILDLCDALSIMKTYFRSLTIPDCGLAYHGHTIIPPESLPTFLDLVLSADGLKQYDDLHDLMGKIIQAKNENKYMIHYGI